MSTEYRGGSPSNGAGVMPSNPFIEILTGTNIAAASLLAFENVNVKHVALAIPIGLAGFEPTTS
jgi:hypothetical protein